MIKLKWNTYVTAGLLFLSISVFFGWFALDYNIGQANDMGPGYFPLLCSGVLMGLALLTLIVSQFISDVPNPEPVRWKDLGLILFAISCFALTIEAGGLLIATLVLYVTSGIIRNDYTMTKNMWLGTIVSVSAYLLLVVGLGMNFFFFPKSWQLF